MGLNEAKRLNTESPELLARLLTDDQDFPEKDKEEFQTLITKKPAPVFRDTDADTANLFRHVGDKQTLRFTLSNDDELRK